MKKPRTVTGAFVLRRRLDALVWAVTALTFGARGEPRVRRL